MPLTILIKYGNVYVRDLKNLKLENTESGLVVTYLDDPTLLTEILDRAANNSQLEAMGLDQVVLSALFEIMANNPDAIDDKFINTVAEKARGILSIVRVTSTEIGHHLPLELVTISSSNEQVPLKVLTDVTFCTVYAPSAPQ